jgi:acetoacetyl-CoA synthetase
MCDTTIRYATWPHLCSTVVVVLTVDAALLECGALVGGESSLRRRLGEPARRQPVSDSDGTPEVLWTPDAQRARDTGIAGFARWVREHRGVELDELDYPALHDWSVRDLEGFWSAVAEQQGVIFHDRPAATLGAREMPGAQWFPGATLNYAEHALTPGPGRADADVAVQFAREDGLRRTVTHAELRDQVGRARAGLVRAGVGRDDRVVALAPNCVETLVLFLAAASLGAIWSSCSPDFGIRAVHDRFAQIEPAVLLAVDGYCYNGRRFDIRPTVEKLRGQLGTVRTTVLLGYLDPDATLDGTVPWPEFTAESGPLEYEAVPFDHPLWVLYSSGTTGLPKGIVHGHGGIVLEHRKALALQMDIGPGERFFWFSTTGWMMWNLLVGGLLVGCTVVLYDGSPGHPDLDALWALAQEQGVTFFGVSAPFLQSCLKAGIRPGERHDLTRMRALGSTGAPLSEEGFRWVADAVGGHVQICSVSGGTDVCAAFLAAAPTVPVWLGELSCAALGADVHAYDEQGHDLHDEVGELVITQPMPSMPVMFWADPDGSRLREAYYTDYPGLWRHGDWVRATPRGSFVVYGRSDSTLNRGGVRMGTADFYAVVEGLDEVADSLVIDTTELGGRHEGELLCFLVLAEGVQLSDVEQTLRATLRSELSPRHVPDRFVVVEAIPRTLNGKKCEVPVKKILAGADPDKAVSRDALQNPEALGPYIELASEPV